MSIINKSVSSSGLRVTSSGLRGRIGSHSSSCHRKHSAAESPPWWTNSL